MAKKFRYHTKKNYNWSVMAFFFLFYFRSFSDYHVPKKGKCSFSIFDLSGDVSTGNEARIKILAQPDKCEQGLEIVFF